jgi:uncharacterized membrane protein YcaP (DUF421 family)
LAVVIYLSALWVFITSVGSVIYLFILTKLMGEKQISQLSLLDYIIGISIGSIAAEAATNLENNVILPFIAMGVYAGANIAITYANRKSIKIRRFMDGRPLILMEDGVLYRENFKKARLDLCDFLMLCRAAGYFNISQIHTAIMEHSGNISFFPRTYCRPATPGDLNLNIEQEQIPTAVIIDGRVCVSNLHRAGKNEAWLLDTLKTQGFRASSEVFFANLDDKGNLSVYPFVSAKPNDSKME